MSTYIVLLRGINVSGKNKLPMVDLRQILSNSGFQNVKTYIQSGNVILTSDKDKIEIGNLIRKEIFVKFGYDIPAIVKTKEEIQDVVQNYPYSKENEKIVGFAFLNKKPKNTVIDIPNVREDKFMVYKDVVYFYCPNGFGKSKLTNNLFEKQLNVIATTRNLRTTLQLINLAS